MELFEIHSGPVRLVHNGFVRPDLAEEWLVELGRQLVPCSGDPPPPWRLDTIMGPVMVKAGRGTKTRRLLRQFTRSPSRSWAAFCVGSRLHTSGVPTPRPLAVLERSSAGHVTADTLLTDWIDAPDLSRLLVKDEPEERTSLITSAARSIASLHAAGCRHRDLKASNLLSAPEGPEVLLADLDGARPCIHGPSHRRRVRDLARLMTSLVVLDGSDGPGSALAEADIDDRCATDGGLLLQRYFEAFPGLVGDDALRRRWQVQATKWVRRKVLVNQRAGRPLS